MSQWVFIFNYVLLYTPRSFYANFGYQPTPYSADLVSPAAEKEILHMQSPLSVMLVCPVWQCFRYSFCLFSALTNPVKKGEMTEEREEGEGEDSLEPKELELTVLRCSRQNGFFVTSSCALQLWQTTVVLLGVSQAYGQTFSVLQLKHFFNEALKHCNFLLGCRGLTIQAAKRHTAICLLPALCGMGRE